MLVYRNLLRDFSLKYVTARRPFVPGDLVDYGTEEFKLLLSNRQLLKLETPEPLCAYVVRDEGSFGMLRIFTNHAEARGFRREARALGPVA